MKELFSEQNKVQTQFEYQFCQLLLHILFHFKEHYFRFVYLKNSHFYNFSIDIWVRLLMLLTMHKQHLHPPTHTSFHLQTRTFLQAPSPLFFLSIPMYPWINRNTRPNNTQLTTYNECVSYLQKIHIYRVWYVFFVSNWNIRSRLLT